MRLTPPAAAPNDNDDDDEPVRARKRKRRGAISDETVGKDADTDADSAAYKDRADKAGDVGGGSAVPIGGVNARRER
ncbi:hypothetical protein LTR66_016261 [Elasticomyces elasticus]|nr:hypothetical protein LTR66_016261 [Elasticomyces elasticus]